MIYWLVSIILFVYKTVLKIKAYANIINEQQNVRNRTRGFINYRVNLRGINDIINPDNLNRNIFRINELLNPILNNRGDFNNNSYNPYNPNYQNINNHQNFNSYNYSF